MADVYMEDVFQEPQDCRPLWQDGFLPGMGKRPRTEDDDPIIQGGGSGTANEEDDDWTAHEPARKRARRWRASSPQSVVVQEEVSVVDESPLSSFPIAARGVLGGHRLFHAPQVDDEYEDHHDEDSPRGVLHSFFQQAVRMSRPGESVGANATAPLFFPLERQGLRRPLRWGRLALCFILSCWAMLMVGVKSIAVTDTTPIPGGSRSSSNSGILPSRQPLSDLTLRSFLSHPDGYGLGMAPAFFGFYGYFGALAAIEDAGLLQPRIQGVAGASAGAMAAILLAAGVSPQQAADFCTTLTLRDFADPPAVLAAFRGDRFEAIMEDFLASQTGSTAVASSGSESEGRAKEEATLLLQDAKIPVAVSAFDLQTLQGQILSMGSMARAARASATFPFLFQPVGWTEEITNSNSNHSQTYEYTLIDGGLGDVAGVEGLKGIGATNRVVNLKIGDFWGAPPGPSDIPGSSAVLSVSIQNLPQPGPWAMEVGAFAVAAASQAIKAALDFPLYQGREANHYELHLDASYFALAARNEKRAENVQKSVPFFRKWTFIVSVIGCYSALSLIRLALIQNRIASKHPSFSPSSLLFWSENGEAAASLVSASSRSFEMEEKEDPPQWLGFSPSRILRRVWVPRGGEGRGGHGAGRWLANSAAGRMLGAAASVFSTSHSGNTWNEHRLTLLPKCILPLDESSYKGSSGRLAIIGGSALYTGAPFYAATAALQTGADLVTIFTADEAATPLKCYSPELMVQSVYAASEFDKHVEDDLQIDDIPDVLTQVPEAREMVEDMIETVCQGVPRYHCLVVGPGLGRCPFVGYAVGKILERVRQGHPQIPIILDADALWFLSQSTELWQTTVVEGNSQIILTPNRMELQRLISASQSGTGWADSATVIQKGVNDTIGTGLFPTDPLICTETGGMKRSGGIGDVLAGTTATLAAWQSILRQQSTVDDNASAVDNNETWIPASWAACHLVKRATHEAWQIKKRSMTAPDVLDCLGGVYEDMIGNVYNEPEL